VRCFKSAVIKRGKVNSTPKNKTIETTIFIIFERKRHRIDNQRETNYLLGLLKVVELKELDIRAEKVFAGVNINKCGDNS